MKKIVIFGVLILLNVYVLAQAPGPGMPGIPHQFYGSVDYQNSPAPDGTVVEAWVNGEKVSEGETLDGLYGYSPNLFFVEDRLNAFTGEIVSFKVGGVDTGESAEFEAGGNTNLDLTVPEYLQTTTTTTQASSGGSSGSSSSRRSSGGSSGGSGGVGAGPVGESCFDGIQNCHDGLCEVGVDCGGSCDPCMSCYDEIQNQGEEGVDCGGPCPPCEEEVQGSVSSPEKSGGDETVTGTEEAPTTTNPAPEQMGSAPKATGNLLFASGGILAVFLFLGASGFTLYYRKFRK